MQLVNNKIAFLVPTYLPHFWRARNLLKSFEKHKLYKQADLYFTFSDEAEMQQFGKYDYKLVLPEELRDSKNERGVINVKKFYSLSQLKCKYEYIIILDSESLFIKDVDLRMMCDSFFDNKVLYGNTTIYEPGTEKALQFIKDTCKKYFQSDISILNKYDYLYLWFNNLFIYKTSTLDNFFETINISENIYNLVFEDFDYYIYMYYLILKEDFKVVDLQTYSIFGMLESYDFIPKPESTMYKTFTPYHCNPRIYHKLNNKNVFVLIQMNVNVFDEGFKKRHPISKLIRQLISCFIPNKELRRKIRGVYR